MRSGDVFLSPSGNQWIDVFELDLTGVRGQPDGIYRFAVRDVDTPTGTEIIYALFPAADVRLWGEVDFERREVVPFRNGMVTVKDDSDPWIVITELYDGSFSTSWRWELEMSCMRGSDRPVDRQAPWREARPEEI